MGQVRSLNDRLRGERLQYHGDGKISARQSRTGVAQNWRDLILSDI
jgi:hypothetical protein